MTKETVDLSLSSLYMTKETVYLFVYFVCLFIAGGLVSPLRCTGCLQIEVRRQPMGEALY